MQKTKEKVFRAKNPSNAKSKLKKTLRNIFTSSLCPHNQIQTVSWFGMSLGREKVQESPSVAWLRVFKAQRGTGSALVILSLGMCLYKRGQFRCLTAPYPPSGFPQLSNKAQNRGNETLVFLMSQVQNQVDVGGEQEYCCWWALIHVDHDSKWN